MKRALTILIVIVLSIIGGLYLWTAILARKKSNELLARFEALDRSLQSSIDSSNNSSGIDSAEQLYPVALLKSQTILLIDSLKENLEKIPESAKPIEISNRLKSDFKRLLNNIQQINKWKWTMVDSKTPDTVRYWARADKFSEKKWLSLFDSATHHEAMIYVNHLRNEISKR